MTDFGRFFRFVDGSLVEQTESTGEPQLVAADSWLVVDGRCRSIDAHFARFASWVSSQPGINSEELDDFFEVVKAAIPKTGRWFPRIEMHSECSDAGRLFLRLREAPEQLGEIRLWTYPGKDPRTNPQIKGPDLSLCLQLRRNAIMHGADEAVLLDDSGFIAEGALSSIVWWRGDVLCAPNAETTWLDSITRTEIFAIANQMGIKTRTELARPADLVGLEVWALSSLQGIRPASEWVGLGSPLGSITHIESFQKRLRMLATQI